MNRSIGWMLICAIFAGTIALTIWHWSTKPDCRDGETPVFNRYIGEWGWFCGRRP